MKIHHRLLALFGIVQRKEELRRQEKARKAEIKREKALRAEAKRDLGPIRERVDELVELRRAGGICGIYQELETFEKRTQHAYFAEKQPGLIRKIQHHMAECRGDAALFSEGYPLPPARETPAYEPDPNTLFYVIQSCEPLRVNGYAIRSHQVLKALRGEGWNAIGITRAGFPMNEKEYRERIASEGEEAVLATLPKPPRFEHDGVPYLFQPSPVTRRMMEKRLQIETTAAFVVEQAQIYRPAVLHAASNYLNGLAAMLAGRQLGIPVVYEVRGLWELTQSFDRPGFAQSDQFALQAKLEAQAAREADRVFAITRGVADTLASRGVERERFTILSNAVDPAAFEPRPRDAALEARYGTAGKVVVGYGGSVTAYEGLELLMEALDGLSEGLRQQVKLLIVGGGPYLETLQQRAGKYEGRLDITFTGRVPFQEMSAHYTLFDIAPLPRLKSPLTDAVSPIKPFELMAMEKALIVSDVDALAEIVAHEQTGLLHRADDSASLRAGLERLVGDEALRRELGRKGREWVITERTWSATARTLGEAYTALLARE